MKKYIILTNTIGRIGGAQIYSRNKKIFLEEKGWEVEIISFIKGNIYIEDLKEYDKNVIGELRHPPSLFTKVKKEKIISKIVGDSDYCDYIETIVESHTINLSLWGELIAERIEGQHIAYILTEEFGNLNKDKLQFLDFKHKRKELAGIVEKSLELLFMGYKKLKKKEKYFLKASCTNVVDDVEDTIIKKIERKDINIACITRLDKKYVIPLIDGIIDFANDNKDKSIQFVFIGGGYNEKKIDIIKDKVKKIGNLDIFITGFLYPIPRNIFKKFDLFIGVSGSAKVSAREGVLTLGVDYKTAKPISLVRYGSNTLYADNSSSISLKEKLNQILIYEKKIETEIINSKFPENNFKKKYKTHMKFINKSSKKKLYYDINNIKATKKDILKRAVYFIPIKFLRQKLLGWYFKIKNIRL
ncbi:MAG: hypothetical protein ACOCP8_05250 [archaeon]